MRLNWRKFAFLQSTCAGFAFALAGCSIASGEDRADTFACTVASISDGDTFRCAELEPSGKQIRVRLSGVNARERDGSCSANHPCPAASAEAATAALSDLALGQRLTCRQEGTTYNRRAAFCRRSDGVDLSCAMVASGTAAKWERYWGGHRCGGSPRPADGGERVPNLHNPQI